MKEEILNKMENHIKQLLEKPILTTDEYAILEEYEKKLPSKRSGTDPLFFLILMMLFMPGGFGHE